MRQSLVLAVLLVLLVVYTLASSAERRKHFECVHGCLKKLNSEPLCNATCTQRISFKKLEVFVDGEQIEPASTLQDQTVEMKGVNFDRNFYNTPETFSDILNFKGELLQQFYSQANSRFVTPGHTYFPGTKLHLLPVPIPLEDSQFQNQDFMNKLLDIVPKEDMEYAPASPLSFSEAYKEFLLSVTVDPNQLEGAPRSPDAQNEIKRRENQLEHIITEYVSIFERCHDAYLQYISKHSLSRISYTLEHFTAHNVECQTADAKLQEHTRLSNDLSNYLNSLNPYNQLFVSIGQMSNTAHYNWNYAKDDIQRFTNYHRKLEKQGITPVESQYLIPVSISRSFFNHKYFGGSSASYSETDITGSLTFSGLGWKESPISPDNRWFNLNTIQSYRTHPLTNGRDFFGANGLLHRIPNYILISYKPTLKIKISRSMKEGFSNLAATTQLRPFETGPFAFTRVDIRTNNGGKVNEEFEMILSANLETPQVIGFKTTPVIYVPPPPPSPAPAYLQFIDKQVALRTTHSTYLRAVNGGDGGQVLTQGGVDRDEKWVVRNAGEGKVFLMSSHGTYLRSHPGGEGAGVDCSVHQGDFEKFTLIQIEGRWALKSVHGTYIRAHGGVGAHVDVSPNLGDWERYHIDVLPTPPHVLFLNRRVSVRTAHGKYLRAHPGAGSKIDQADGVGEYERWRIVYVGGEMVAFLSVHGTYLRSPPDQHIEHKKKKWYGGSKRWTEVIPSRAVAQNGIDDCSKFQLVQVDAERVALRSICQNKYLQALDNGEIGALPSIGGWEQFIIQLELTPGEREPDCRYMALQLYREYLEREGEPDGVNGLVHECSHTNTPVPNLKHDYAQRFIDSPEYRGKMQEIVQTAYKTYLSRDAEQGGLDGWTNYGIGLRTTLAAARNDVNHQIQNSAEGRANLCRPIIIQLYRDYLEREAEPKGLEAGLENCKASSTPMSGVRDVIAKGFMSSPEYRGKIQEIVKNAYRVYLGREAEPGGLEAWTNNAVAVQAANIQQARDYVNHHISESREAKCKPLIMQLYREYLEREAEPKGLNAALVQCTRSETPILEMRAALAPGFRASPEYRGKMEEIVKEAYRRYLLREGEAAGVEAWTNNGVALGVGSLNEARNHIYHQFQQSREAKCKPIILQLYRDYLDREAEPEGFSGAMTNCIRSQTPMENIRDELAAGFRSSPEYRGKVAKFVKHAYKTYLGREAEEAGLEAWTNNGVAVQAANLEQVRNHINHHISESREAKCKPIVQQLYRNFLEREAEPKGLQAATVNCINSQTPLDQIYGQFAAGFRSSPEYRGKVGQVVANAYRQLLGREPDQGGLDGWTNNAVAVEANSLQEVRQFIHNSFTQSREYQCRSIVQSSYRTLLRREPDAGGYSNYMRYCSVNRAAESIETVKNELHGIFVGSAEYRAKN